MVTMSAKVDELKEVFELYKTKTGWKGLDAESGIESFLSFYERETQRQAAAQDQIQSLSSVQLDPKGHVVLAEFGNDALVFTGRQAVEPFVCASGYDAKTGEWTSGSYYSDISRAYERINPEIIEQSCVRWEREDFRAALIDQGLEATEDNVNALAVLSDYMEGWKDWAIENGNEDLTDYAEDFVKTQRASDRSDTSRSNSLNAVCADFRHAAEAQDNVSYTEPSHNTEDPNL